jgi:outer membrane protein OmpA-like peptidoglycan-associated protein
MRNTFGSLVSLLALALVAPAASAQTGTAAPPPASWPPPTAAPTYPAPAYPAPYPAPAPTYPAPTPAPAPAPIPAYPAPAPAPAPAPEPAPAPIIAPAPAPAPEPAPPAAPVAAEPESVKTPSSEMAASESDERPRGFVPQLSLGGSVGMLRMAAAEVGNVAQFRLTLHGEYFKGSNFLIQSESPAASDRNTRLQGALAFGVTPIDHLEIFGAVLGSANRNRRLCSNDISGQEVCVSEANRTDPELIKSFGDLLFGAKLAYGLAPGFSAGAELGVRLMSSISGISFSPDSTSLWVNALGSYDLKPATESVPLRFHLNLGYYVDRSRHLVDYDANSTSAFSRYVSQFAYGIAGSRLRVALGADAPLHELAEGFSLRPIVEYHFEYLTNDPDPVIDRQQHDVGQCGQPGNEACKDNKDQHWVTLGVQGQVLHGLTLTLGLDVALRSPGYAYGPALAPWNVLFALGYALDLVPRVVRNVPVEKIVTKEVAMAEGVVAGRVISAAGTPVEGAIVGVSGRQHSRVVTEADGSFQSVPLAPGPVELVVVANGFETATVRTEIIAGQTANIVLRLTPKPPAARASGRISDDSGKGVAAAIKLAGPQIAEGRSDESGNFSIPVAPGVYTLRVDASQYLSKEMQITVADGREGGVSITLRSRPMVAGVTFKDGKFKLRQAVTFKPAGGKPGSELTAGMPLLLDEVVDVLANHSEIRQIRVEAHWDSGIAAAKALALTDAQAKSVAKYLVDQGIAAERVAAEGMGAKKPIVPNLGAGKSKNRRVEFVVVQ